MAEIDAIIGCLLGTAVGDALGLPFEGLSKRRQHVMYSEINKYHFLWGRGMVSDDTEHTCMVAQSLIVSSGDVQKFSQQLARRLRFWLLGLPAGVGFATLRAILKLWLGFSPDCSGVFSAGNGPAMRSAIIGVCYGDNPQKLRELVRVSTKITHSDPKAEFGALAVAIAAHIASNKIDISPQQYYHILQNLLDSSATEFLELIKQAVESAAQQQTTQTFVTQIGLHNGISGYIYRTVPVVIQTWLRHQQNYQVAILEIIRCGGDSDTAAAILGGIIGARVGKSGIPPYWLDNLQEWPRTIQWMEAVGMRLERVCDSGKSLQALPLPIYGILLRNICFLVVVLIHGFRRLLPPY